MPGGHASDAGRAPGRVARDLGPLRLYRRLLAEYGELDWWPAEGPFEVMVGAVLTQRTAWANVERALEALKAAGVDGPAALLALPPARLEELVRPSGTYRQKAARLRALFAVVESSGGMRAFLSLPPAELRRRLLAVRGIGPETADSIVLYAAGGRVFVVDAYTRRLLGRLGMGVGAEGYDRVAAWFVRGLPGDVGTYRNAHAVIVEHCKRRCRSVPLCGGCPLAGECPSAVEG
jgi:endonuclease III related protein